MHINKLLIICLFFISIGARSEKFPTEAEHNLTRWVMNITKSLSSRATTRDPDWTPDQVRGDSRIDFNVLLDSSEADLRDLNHKLALLVEDEQAIRLLQSILTGLAGPEGELLRTILRDAARCPKAREQLLSDMKWEICAKGGLWSGPDPLDLVSCGVPGAVWETHKISFSQSTLKANIDAFEARMEELTKQCFDKSWLDRPRELDKYEAHFKLFLELEPKLIGLLNLGIRYARFLSGNETDDLKQILVNAKNKTDELIEIINISKN